MWRLRIAGILRFAYYLINRPRTGIVIREVGSINASFFVRTPWELRTLDPVGGMGRELHVLEKIISIATPGDVVFDVGSNFGVYTVMLAKAVGPTGMIVAFEPEPQAYNHLEDNIALNSLDNVRPLNLALGDKEREDKLFLQHTGASRLSLPTVVDGGYQMVSVREGDKLVESENLPIPQIVKIDVEGHEWSVMNGMKNILRSPRCHTVCCEIHPPLLPQGVKSDDITNLLSDLGFQQTDIIQRGTSEYHALSRKA